MTRAETMHWTQDGIWSEDNAGGPPMRRTARDHEDALGRRTMRRVAWRLMPFLLLLYLVAYLDRANVSFAGLTMTHDLGFNPAVFGLGIGLFFPGYVLFEIPGTILVESWSARRWFA